MGLGIGGIVSVGGSSAGGSFSGSGIANINGQTGPSVLVNGVNGITVSSLGNVITINGAALSGLILGGSSLSSYAAAFVNITSGVFQHNFNSRNVLVQVFDNSSPPRRIEPDETILDTLNDVSLIFNVQQTGFVVIHGPSGTSSGGVTKFASSFSSISSGLFTHGLGTLDVIVQVYNDGTPRRAIMPDDIIVENSTQVSLIFNSPQSGRVVIV